MRSALSARQEECLRLTAFRTDREIAAVLGISEATVKKHVHEACQRLGVKRRKAALAMLTSNDAVPLVATQAGPVAASARESVAEPVADGRRFGYRPPPRSPYLRMLMVAGLMVILTVTTTAVTAMIGDYHVVVGRFATQTAMAAPPRASALR